MSAYQHVAHLPFNHLLEKINSSTNVKKLLFFPNNRPSNHLYLQLTTRLHTMLIDLS